MKKQIYSIVLSSLLLLSSCHIDRTDVLIIGGGASGTAAGVQAARMGVKTVIVEEFDWLGGMLTSAGVSAVDGNYNLPSGFFGEFCDSIAARYGGYDSLKTGWVSNVLFEPSVGNAVLKNIVARETNLSVRYHTTVSKIEKMASGEWKVTLLSKGKYSDIHARVLVDATELGDVAKQCGVKYDIGMDARSASGEEIAPEQANNIIQDLTYVAVLKDYGPHADQTIAKPEGYDPSPFYCACRVPACTQPKEKQRVWDCSEMLTYGKLPNGKYMINWPIEGNDYYLNIIEMTPDERNEALKKAKLFTLSFLYYMQTELGMKNLGLADDEYPTDDRLPYIPYHRESRRIHGLVRFTVNDVARPYQQADPLYRTGIAVGDYPVDHHHARYPQWDKLPDLHFYPVPSYSLPLGVLIPQDVRGLIVAEKSISVSNLINGSTRLQPVVLQIGQAAGALAALTVKSRGDVADVSVRQVQNSLLASGAYLMPYLDLPKSDARFAAVQRIGASGLLKGEGMNVGWTNQTWFYIDRPLQGKELAEGVRELYPQLTISVPDQPLTVGLAIESLNSIALSLGLAVRADQALWAALGGGPFDTERIITRGEFALLADRVLDPFNRLEVDHRGRFVSLRKP